MLTAYAVDDEQAALERVAALMDAHPLLELRRTFTRGVPLLECFRQVPADVVLLDIEMPGMSGLEVAHALRAMKEDVHLVFTTAHSHFALEAFDCYALGYVLKPLQQEPFDRIMNRIGRLHGNHTGLAEALEPHIYGQWPGAYATMFNRFLLICTGDGAGKEGQIQGQILKFRTSKVEELFAYLLHHQGKPVGKEQLIDILWSNRTFEKGMNNLYSSVYQLRQHLKSIGLDGYIHQTKGGLRSYWVQLDERLNSDLSMFKSLVAVLRRSYAVSLSGSGSGSGAGFVATQEAASALEQALKLYGGPYLGQNDYGWAKELRAALERDYVFVLQLQAERSLYMKEYAAAVPVLELQLEFEPFSEPLHQKLLAVYWLLREEKKAARLYAQFQDSFRQELQEEPSFNLAQIAEAPERFLKI